mmetsp:Transcript_28039/g.74060  ORF Transcript_28039/g.74060 Transcript_28039/m.74060 type:complete len:232 (-) Transcript_28039:2197-2892(-)
MSLLSAFNWSMLMMLCRCLSSLLSTLAFRDAANSFNASSETNGCGTSPSPRNVLLASTRLWIVSAPSVPPVSPEPSKIRFVTLLPTLCERSSIARKFCNNVAVTCCLKLAWFADRSSNLALVRSAVRCTPLSAFQKSAICTSPSPPSPSATASCNSFICRFSTSICAPSSTGLSQRSGSTIDLGDIGDRTRFLAPTGAFSRPSKAPMRFSSCMSRSLTAAVAARSAGGPSP